MTNRVLKTTIALLVTAVALAGCGSTGGSSASKLAAATSNQPRVDVAAVEASLAQYTGHPTAFPVDKPLKIRPTGKTFVFLQCSTPVCALFAQALQPTQKLLGYKLTIVKAGPSATDVQSAMDSVVSLKPAGVLLPGTDPNQYLRQIKQLEQAKIPISANGVVDPSKYGIRADFFSNDFDRLIAKLMADWAATQAGGGEVAFYGTPGLSDSPLIQAAFDRQMAAVCPSCTVRNVEIPIADFGTTAPGLVVSDLQSHPNTKVIAFPSAEAGTGLPAALSAAGQKVKIIGSGPTPAVLGYIKQGQWDAAVGVDGFTTIWGQLDALARMVAGQPLTAVEKTGLPPLQILTRPDITFNPATGWVAYPNYAARFAKLWGAGQ